MAIGAYTSSLIPLSGRAYTIDRGAKIRLQHFAIAAPSVAGDDGSYADLCILPPGRVRVLPHLSLVWTTAFGASRVVKTGHRAYVGESDVAVDEDDDAFGSAVDISGATNGVKLGTARKYDVYSKKGVQVFATVTGGTWPTTGTFAGYIAYSLD
jgi:hypothetical protein